MNHVTEQAVERVVEALHAKKGGIVLEREEGALAVACAPAGASFSSAADRYPERPALGSSEGCAIFAAIGAARDWHRSGYQYFRLDLSALVVVNGAVRIATVTKPAVENRVKGRVDRPSAVCLGADPSTQDQLGRTQRR